MRDSVNQVTMNIHHAHESSKKVTNFGRKAMFLVVYALLLWFSSLVITGPVQMNYYGIIQPVGEMKWGVTVFKKPDEERK